MLSAVQAALIVGDCIRQAAGWAGDIEGENQLQEVGIVDLDMREALNDDIVTDPGKGVQSAGHQLGPDDLTFTIASTVSQLTAEVMNKARPV